MNAPVICTYIGWWYDDGTFEPIMLLGCSGGDGDISPTYGDGVGGHGGGGGGGGNNGDNSGLTMPPPPKIPIADMQKFLSCFNIQQSANLTIYAAQMGSSSLAGHAFITITQGNNTMTFGFYPKNGYAQQLIGPGIFGDDSGHPYTNAWDAGSITPTQLQQIIATALAYSNSNYNLGFSNCSDFVLSVLNLIGLTNNTAGVNTPDDVATLIGHFANGTASSTHRTCN